MLTKPLVRVFLFGNAVNEWLVPLLNINQIPSNYDNGIVFVRNQDAIAEEYSNFSVVKSQYVPHNTQLIVLPQDVSYADMHPNATDSLFILDVWTFLNNESMETAKMYRHNYPYTELRIIMVNTNRKTLSTDISNVKLALDNAVSEYEQEGFSVTVIKENDISMLFFWQNRRYHDMLKRDFKDKLQNVKNTMEFNYELHYEFLSEMLKDDMLHPKSLEKFTRYDENLGISKINKIIDTTTKAFFSENSMFIKELNGIFTTFTKSICLWDEYKVFGNLMDILAQYFIETMKQALPAVSINYLNEISYQEFMFNTKFNVIFVQQCNVFFSEIAKKITKIYIDSLLVKMEELL